MGDKPFDCKPRLKRLKNGPFLGALMAGISGGPIGWRDRFGQCAAIFTRRAFRLESGRPGGRAGNRPGNRAGKRAGNRAGNRTRKSPRNGGRAGKRTAKSPRNGGLNVRLWRRA